MFPNDLPTSSGPHLLNVPLYPNRPILGTKFNTWTFGDMEHPNTGTCHTATHLKLWACPLMSWVSTACPASQTSHKWPESLTSATLAPITGHCTCCPICLELGLLPSYSPSDPAKSSFPADFPLWLPWPVTGSFSTYALPSEALECRPFYPWSTHI